MPRMVAIADTPAFAPDYATPITAIAMPSPLCRLHYADISPSSRFAARCYTPVSERMKCRHRRYAAAISPAAMPPAAAVCHAALPPRRCCYAARFAAVNIRHISRRR